jgi:hypothetical protein
MERKLRPLGVPLHEVEEILRESNFDVLRDGNTLVLRRYNPVIGEPLVTRIAVMPPEPKDAKSGTVKAVVRVFTLLPNAYGECFDAEMLCFVNRHAGLGAVTVTKEASFIGSRFTVHADNEDWDEQCPLIAASAATAQVAITTVRRVLNKEPTLPAASAWTLADFEQVTAALGENCATTCAPDRMTAEFPLKPQGPLSAFAAESPADDMTAFWELLTTPPHIELGGGLFCMLQLPQRFPQSQSRHPAVNLLNISEMSSGVLPPHIGAWCEGRFGDNFAYVSYLPNVLHALPGIAIHVSRWAQRRAETVANLLDAAGATVAMP